MWDCKGFIKDGPGRYDLFIRGLLEHGEVTFTVGYKDKPQQRLKVLVLGARRMNKNWRFDTWFLDVVIITPNWDREDATFCYHPQTKRGFIPENLEHAACTNFEVVMDVNAEWFKSTRSSND